ncbi:MAG: O-antigen ligase family protein [Chloroflexi bacterium]|nr:O-antigen ligase family protein [Chloroflexota bacterium]
MKISTDPGLMLVWFFVSWWAIVLTGASSFLGVALAVLGGLLTGAVGLAGRPPADAVGPSSSAGGAAHSNWIRRQWLILLLLAPLFLFPGGWRTLALLSLPILWGVRWAMLGSPVPTTPLDRPVLLVLVMVLVGEWATYDLAQSLPKIAGLLWGVGVYYAAVDAMGDRAGWGQGVVALLLAGLGVAGLGLLGTQWPMKIPGLAPVTDQLPLLIRGLPGAEGGFNPNEVGGALIWTIPPGFALALGGWRTRRLGWLAGGGAALFMLAVVLLAQSRGALVGLAAGMLGVGLVVGGRRLRLAAIGAVVVVALAIAWVGPRQVGERFLDHPERLAAGQSIGLTGRVELWSRALVAIGDFPITGLGLNTFRVVMPVIYPAPWSSTDRDIGHAHNELLQAALDLGLPGLVAFVSLHTVAGAVLYRACQQTEDRFHRYALAGVGAGLAGHLVYGLTDAIALGAKPGFIFWLLLALAVAPGRWTRQLGNQGQLC